MTDSTQQSILPRKSVLWVYLSGAMALIIVVMSFLPQSGLGGSVASVYSVMLWVGIFGAAVARYRERSGWFGFAVGSAAGMFLFVLSQFF